MVRKVENSQILMIPGGFSAGDEPDGSGKFIAAFFRNPHVLNRLLTNYFLNAMDLHLVFAMDFRHLLNWVWFHLVILPKWNRIALH